MCREGKGIKQPRSGGFVMANSRGRRNRILVHFAEAEEAIDMILGN